MIIRLVLFLLTSLTLFSVVLSQSISPDKTFGDNGFVFDNRPNVSGADYQILVLDDGSYITLGFNFDFFGAFSTIKKFTKSGQAELSFGDNGIVKLPLGSIDLPTNFILLPDNKIACFFFEDLTKIAVMILSENGELISLTEYSDPDYEGVYLPVKLLYRDNYFYVAGNFGILDDFYPERVDSIFVVKFDWSGQPDTSFADHGVFVLDEYKNVELTDMAFQNDRLLIAGDTYYPNDLSFLYRLDSTGTIDQTFANNGIFILEHVYFPYIKTDPENDIYITGFDAPVVWKLDENGHPDLNYGLGSMAYEALTVSEEFETFFSLLTDDGSVLLFGAIYSDDSYDYQNPVIIKYNKDGNLDKGFGNDGIYYENELENATYINGAFDDEGKLLAAGWFISEEDIEKGFMARYKYTTSATNDHQYRDLIVYPNPVSGDYLTVSFYSSESFTVSLTVLDMNGQIVQNTLQKQVHAGYNHFGINLDQVSAGGTYILKLAGEKGVTHRKIIQIR